jgi:tRNA G18 (ribose-2'-O)-methylase SpoU
MPHVLDLSADDLLSLLPEHVRLVAAVAGPGAASAFGDSPLTPPIALALGSEGSGLTPQIERAAVVRLRVPSAGDVESLNVAAAGAVLMFEIARRAGRLL